MSFWETLGFVVFMERVSHIMHKNPTSVFWELRLNGKRKAEDIVDICSVQKCDAVWSFVQIL